MTSTIRPDTRSLDRHLVLVLHNFVIPKRSFQLKEKSTFRAKALRRELIVTVTRRAFARNVDFSFIVSGSERTFTFRVSLNTLTTLATLVRDIFS